VSVLGVNDVGEHSKRGGMLEQGLEVRRNDVPIRYQSGALATGHVKSICATAVPSNAEISVMPLETLVGAMMIVVPAESSVLEGRGRCGRL